MLESLGVNGPDLVDVKVELRGLGGDALGYLLELGVAAPHNGPCTSALRWTIVCSQAASIVTVYNMAKIQFKELCANMKQSVLILLWVCL